MESSISQNPIAAPQNILPVVDASTTRSFDDPTSSEPGRACCSLARHAASCPIHRAMWGMTFAIVLFGTLTIGYLVWFTQQHSTATQWEFPATVDATAAVSSEKYSMATGPVGDESEGLFVLDHNSGLLQCSIIYPRMARFLGLFTVNVGDALGTGGKGGSYIMVTGQADFPRTNANPVATTVAYVLNTATGKFAAYAIPFDRTMVNAGRPQQGTMILLNSGDANPVIDRDAIRP
jgi:hypothetical protein